MNKYKTLYFLVPLLFVFCEYSLAQEIDTRYWYKISNSYLGADYSLSVLTNDDHNPVMKKSENTKDEKWKFIKEHENYYRIINEEVGEYRSLDNYLDTNEPFLGKTGIFDAQFWLLTPAGENIYQLTNLLLGTEKALSINPKDKLKLAMEKIEKSETQFWMFEKIDSVKSTSEMSVIKK